MLYDSLSNSCFASRGRFVPAGHKLHMNVVFFTYMIRKLLLTCSLCRGLEHNDEPQQHPREAHLDGEQLLSLSPPGFAPPPAEHHSSSDGRLRHPFNHHAGHSALLEASVPAEPPLVVHRYEEVKRAGRD